MYTGDYTPWHRHTPALLLTRDIGDVKDTFSSWDKCMDKNYCKWPVIAAIIVGSLILLSVLWCIFSCMCCATRVCCCCTDCVRSCCSCCWCGGDDHDRRRSRANKGEYIKYGDSNSVIASQPPPMPAPVYYAPPAPVPPQPMPQPPPPPPPESQPHLPQVATFESPRKSPSIPQEAAGTAKFNPDSLPHMPAWSEAKTRYVEEEPLADNVEMNNLPPVIHPPSRHASPLAQTRNVPPPPRTMTPLVSSNPPVIPQPPPLSHSPIPRIATPAYEYNENTPLNQQPAPAAAWNDLYYNNSNNNNDITAAAQDPMGYGSQPLPIPAPNHQHYAQPNSAPYPLSTAGDRATYGYDVPEYNAQSHDGYGYGYDSWNHHPSAQQQQQQQYDDYTMSNNNNLMYGDAQAAARRAGASAGAGGDRLPSMLAPGPKPNVAGSAQRQSAELGF